MSKLKYNIFVYAIVVLIGFSFYSHIQCADIIDTYNKLISTKGINNIESSTNFKPGVSITLIPGSEPIIEIMSVTNLFNKLYLVKEEYNVENQKEIFQELSSTYYDFIGNINISVFDRYYYDTISNMIEYFKNYSEFGNDSKLTISSKDSLNQSINLLKIINIFKIITFILLIILSIIGFIIIRMRLRDDGKERR